MCCHRQKAATGTDVDRLLPDQPEEMLPGFERHSLLRGEGLVLRGLDIVHPTFSDLVSLPPISPASFVQMTNPPIL